jgi:hypothetical protein
MSDPSDEIKSLKADNELLKFKAQASEQLLVHEKLIRELTFYTSIVKYALAALGLGSLGAVVLFWPSVSRQIDKDVADQMQKWNDLDAAFSLTLEHRWHEALDGLKKVFENHVQKNKSLDSAYRSSVYDALVLTLASTSEPVGSLTWNGEQAWRDLGEDPAFKVQFLNRARDKWDEGYCNQMFLCTLKFGARNTSLKTVHEYLERALEKAPVKTSMADHEFELAMEALAANHSEDVQSHLEKASGYDPSRYKDLPDALRKFKDELTFKMWCTYTAGLNERDMGSGIKDFESKFDELITQLSGKE